MSIPKTGCYCGEQTWPGVSKKPLPTDSKVLRRTDNKKAAERLLTCRQSLRSAFSFLMCSPHPAIFREKITVTGKDYGYRKRSRLLEKITGICIFHIESFCHVFAGQLAVVGIDAGVNDIIVTARLFQALARNLQAIFQGCIAKGDG